MDVFIDCLCGRRLKASSAFIGTQANCPFCGKLLSIKASYPPAAEPPVMAEIVEPSPPEAAQAQHRAHPIPEYREPPKKPIPPKPKRTISWGKMFEALLDPRSIQWMLAIGGALGVLGLLIWLGSLGIFENKLVLALAMGIGTAAVIAAGWWLVLKTRYQTAGRALTMLGCLVAPLNLWFYHSQGLLTLQDNLWIGGVVCCLLYLATVLVLRDPLFMYVVEAGVTLTAGLFLAEWQHASDTTYLSGLLMALGLVSIHAERIFPVEAECFGRKRFGMPLFRSGQAQVAAALLILACTQVFGWLIDPARAFVQADWKGNLLTESSLLASALWMAGAYAYLYSDIVVRRVGVYVYLAAICILMGALTAVGLDVGSQWLIAGFALAGLAINLMSCRASGEDRLHRAVRPIAFVASFLAILLGMLLHVRATSQAIPVGWRYDAGWEFIGAMLVAAVANRASAWFLRGTHWSPGYFFASAAALLITAAGILREFGLEIWLNQAPVLMLLAIGYLVAAYLWRGKDPEKPLGQVAHAATAIIVAGSLMSAWRVAGLDLVAQYTDAIRLFLALIFAEAMVFYIVASVVRRRSINVHLAAAAACGALWQLLGYFDVHPGYQTLVYAALGFVLLVAGRMLGANEATVYNEEGSKRRALEGKGRAAFQAGNAILTIAVMAMILMQGMAIMGSVKADWIALTGLVVLIAISLLASVIVPQRAWRRFYVTAAIALGAILFITVQMRLELTTGQKFEIFSTIVGMLLVVIGYAGRFREAGDKESDGVTLALWLGSVMATMPVLVATIYHRAPSHDISGIDELALIAITVVLLITGLSWQVKSTTFFGGAVLILYLMLVVVSLGWRNQVAVGIYLTIGGGLLFACGIGLSIYRDRLLELPGRISRREGLFRVLNWR